jgi:hypothetical protein
MGSEAYDSMAERLPRVLHLVTGDEIVAPEQKPKP